MVKTKPENSRERFRCRVEGRPRDLVEVAFSHAMAEWCVMRNQRIVAHFLNQTAALGAARRLCDTGTIDGGAG